MFDNKYIYIIGLFIVFILSSTITSYVSRMFIPQYVEVETEGKIDSTKWVSRATYESQRSLLRKVDKEFKDRIEKSNRTIATLARINGTLRLQKDSLILENKNNTRIDTTYTLSIVENKIQDTTIITKRTFNKEMFMVESKVSIIDNSISNEIDLKQLRNINIELIVSISDDNSQVYSYVSSDDFVELNIENKTALKRKNSFPKFWTGVGVGVASIVLLNGLVN